MDTFMGRYRNVSILAAAVFIQLIGLAYQVKKQTGKDSGESRRLLRVWTISAITPLEKVIVRLQTGSSNVWHNYVYLRGVRQENRELKDKLEQLQLEQVRLQQDAVQARRLQALLGFKEQFIDQTVAAQVIGSSGSEQSRTVYLDKGSEAGIKLGMPVISSDGIVGKVILVQPGVAQVLLINDQTSGVGTILERSRLQGVLKGRPSGELMLDKVMSEEDIRPGEQVLTSGGDQIFPKGLPVGTIGEVKRGGEFLQVNVKPAASLSHLEEVLVITKKQERQPEAAVGVSSVRAADILAQRLPQVPDKPASPPAPQSTTGTTTAKPLNAAGAPAAAGAVQSRAVTLPAGAQGTPHPVAASSTAGSIPAVNKPVQPKTAPAASTAAAQQTSQPPSQPPSQPKTAPSGTAPTGPTSKPTAATPQSSTQPETGDAPQ